MNKLIDYKDKTRKHKQHTIIGFIIALITFLIIGYDLEKYFNFNFTNYELHWSYVFIAAFISLVAGIVKEFYDSLKGFKMDVGDIVATFLGGIIFIPIGILITLI